MEKITLQVNGREMTFSEQELSSILEKHFFSKVSPTEGEWFEVKPMAIDQKLFEKKRTNQFQEETRQWILKAFDQLKDNPEKYGKNFETMMPKSTMHQKTAKQLVELASKLGDHNADWVEQALEWAQRIANGEWWGSLCNSKDTANWYRLVLCPEDECILLIGGSLEHGDSRPASYVLGRHYSIGYKINYATPLVVRYTE